MIATYRRLFGLLEAADRRRFWVLVALSMAVGVLEALGVASVLPFIAVAGNPEAIETVPGGQFATDLLGVEDPSTILPLLGLLAFTIVVAGNALRAFVFWRMTRFTRMRAYDLARRLLARYLSHPYAWFLGRNTAHLGRSLLSEVQQVVDGVIAPAMRLIVNVMITIFIVALLIAIEPVVSLAAAAIIGGAYAVVYLLSKGPLARLGRERVRLNKKRFKIAQEATSGVKDVKIRNLEPVYLDRFKGAARRLAQVQARATLISELPHHALEAIGFGTLLLFVTWLLARDGGQELTAILPTIAAFGFAAVRLFPVTKEVFRAVAKLRFGAAALNSIAAEISERPALAPEGEDAPPIPLARRLTLENVTYRYPNHPLAALDGISLDIPALSTVGIVGSTGAGKSTLVDLILGLLTPETGTMRADNVVIDVTNRRGWRKSIGYVPQAIFLADASVAANIAFGLPPEQIDMDRVERCARVAELHGFVASLPQGYDTGVGERGVRLSGGQRQRVGIARALYHDPELLVFDEATSALDTITEMTVMGAIARLSGVKTILLVAHRLSTVRKCDTIFVLEHGRLVASGRYDELVRRHERFRALHEAGL